MQNLDWNKCFQRVSDAGLHFPFVPLLWLACMCVHSRPTTQDAWGGASMHQHSPPAAWCSSLKWMRAGVHIKQGRAFGSIRFGHTETHVPVITSAVPKHKNQAKVGNTDNY